ncbi:hypothetical protein J3R08_000573 [Micromonospora sp. HB375]|uniref:hypothetical protein n=1 Tax=unclassified Micromonospora TaxID=2617518 RepID=UPI001AE1B8D9|nr:MULTISPECIES: hypothetical protein [unclassified Micromonospora]MBP1780723.1 hypothetical protein [Micromonospora sp. HB375]MDH6472148.1 hypothetical protein [Micromonospora sp. H404/HB375]
MTTPRTRRRRLLSARTVAWIELVALIVAVGALARDVFDWKIPGTASEDRQKIQIDVPESGTLSRCATLQGSAPRIKGKTLWMAHISPGGRYNFALATYDDNGRWRATDTFGSESDVNQRFRVVVFLVDQETSSFLTGIRGESADGKPPSEYWAQGLPPGAAHEASLMVTRDGTRGQPHCGQLGT